VADSSAAFVGSIPELYDRHLGPLLFEPYARDLAARLAPLATPRRALELACGTGILTAQLRERLAGDVALVATDLNDAMLEVARQRLGARSALSFRQADAQSLPFPDAEFTAVVCQFGWMFFPDKPRAAREALRVLGSGGQLLFNVWDSLAENPLGRVVHETLAQLFPVDPPDFYRVPFGFHDAAEIRAQLREAGFERIEVEHVALTAHAPSAEHAAIGLVRGNPVISAIQQRGADPERVVDTVAAALRAQLGAGALDAPMRALAISARQP